MQFKGANAEILCMRRKLSDADVQRIRIMGSGTWHNRIPIYDIAAEFGVSVRTVKYVLAGREYKEEKCPPGAEGLRKYQWTEEHYQLKLTKNRERARKRRGVKSKT